MSIQGTDSIVKFGMAIMYGVSLTACIGFSIGLGAGLVHHWPGYAIGLITTGGLIMTAGIVGGTTIACRGMHLKLQDQERLSNVFKGVWDGSDNFDEQT